MLRNPAARRTLLDGYAGTAARLAHHATAAGETINLYRTTTGYESVYYYAVDHQSTGDWQRMVFGEDGAVYLENPINSIYTQTWIKGYRTEGDTIAFQLPQAIFSEEDVFSGDTRYGYLERVRPGERNGKQTAAWGVAVPGSRTQSASAMRFLNMGLGAPMAAPRAVGNDPVSSVTTPGFGWADGPDGNQWYYTQNYKLDGYFYSGSTITLYDNNNQQVGQFDIDVPDTLQVNSIEMYSALTKKMFDRDDTSIEAMVSIHAVGNAENNYKDCYITRAYHIDGSGIAYECEGSGMLFDASKGWNTYQRLILPIEKVIDGKEYVSIDFIAPPTWGKDEPYVEHTLDIPFENINYMDGAYINCFVIEDKPYYVVAQYDTAYCTMPEDYTQDIIVTPNNHFVLKTYDRNYSLVDSVAVPIEESPKGIYRMAAFGRMSDNDMLEVENWVLHGDKHAELILNAMIWNVAKCIAAEGAVLKGKVDAILLTGGLARSQYITDHIKERVEFIAPVTIYPGQDEMKALTENALAVLRGERQAMDYGEAANNENDL